MKPMVNRLFKHWTYRIFSPGVVLRDTYEAFKDLLASDGRSHELMAEFELLYHEDQPEDFARISKRYEEFSSSVEEMIDALARMAPGSWGSLRDYFRKFDFYIQFLLAPPTLDQDPPYVLDLESGDLIGEQAGNKALNLSVLKRDLQAPVPAGFVITVSAYNHFIEYNDLRNRIDDLLAQIDPADQESLQQGADKLMGLILHADLVPDIKDGILVAYNRMEKRCGREVRTAVRSSALSEDGAQSFAGQYHTELGVSRHTVLQSYLEVLASKFTPQALLYRMSYGLRDDEAPMAVLVLEMVDAAVSGVIYTQDPTADQAEDTLMIQSVFGLGEMLVSGEVTPDTFRLQGVDYELVTSKQGQQHEKLVIDKGGMPVVHEMPQAAELSISDAQARELARWGKKIEKHYGTMQDIEWAALADGTLFFLQSRPLHRQQDVQEVETETTRALIAAQPLLQGGERASGGAASGTVYVLDHRHPVEDIPDHAILVTENIPPSLARIIDRLAGVVAGRGSTVGHFATVCREFGVPLLAGVGSDIQRLEFGSQVTLDTATFSVYPGIVMGLAAAASRPAANRETPYYKKLRTVLDFIAPLKLVDAKAADFVPESCRSMHDLIRFTHEKAVQSMFSLSDRFRGGTKGRRKLHTTIPLDVFLIDVGEGLCRGVGDEHEVSVEQICSTPFTALWQGLIHPDIEWGSHSHFDWKSFDEVALAGGIASTKSGDFASYAIVGGDYLNLNMRFGYHFTLVDALCGDTARENYCSLRFAGGGGNFTGRSLRIEFLVKVLQQIGFEVHTKGDLLDAKVTGQEKEDMITYLDMLGRLLGATRLMDMVLQEGADVDEFVEAFFQGKYRFGSEEV